MEMQGYFTQRGLALSAKLLTGNTLTITRVVAGAGSTSDPVAATSLPQPKQTLAVNTPTRSGNTATIPATLTAAQASADYTLTELGVFAKDPDEGEILYKLYQLSEPVDITVGSRMVLRFYLEETVSQDLNVTVSCSPAGLITEADLVPVRDKIASSVVYTRELSMDIGELQAFLDSLPRLLTEILVITVSGTLNTALRIRNFYGNGSIRLQADAETGCTIQQAIYITNCDLPIQIWSIQMVAPVGLTAYGGICNISYSRYVRLWKCTLTGHNKETNVFGINADDGSRVLCESCFISGFDTVVFAGRLSSVLVYGGTDDYFDNTYGAYVWYGGTVLMSGNVSDTLGGGTNRKNGGLIVKADGTLL